MAGTRLTIVVPHELATRLEMLASQHGLNTSALLRLAVDRAFPPESDAISQDPVEFLLKPGDPSKPPSWDNGGRWLLDWFIRREPTWQSHHLVVLPRHWPLSLDTPDTRCHDNGGDRRSVLDHLRDLADSRIFPAGVTDLSIPGWIEVCARYRACCDERLRPPSGPHWDAVCR